MIKITKITNSEIVWPNVVMLLLYHYAGLQGLYYILTLQLKWQTFIWSVLLVYATGLSITAGVHRLWSHKCYKARLPLRILLSFFQTAAFQNSIYEWCRDHRVHHKFTDTDADPHNANRGFFFSHMGWLMVRKHPDVQTKGKTVDMSDLQRDPIIRFQHKYYPFLGPIMCFVVPTLIPWYFWNEKLYIAFTVSGIVRSLFVLHVTWCVNSVAHIWGTKPYNKYIKPCENGALSKVALGEGWHNYHHVFPWDYKAAELDSYNGNFTLGFLHLMAKINWAYDLKTVTNEMIQNRIKKLNQRLD